MYLTCSKRLAAKMLLYGLLTCMPCAGRLAEAADNIHLRGGLENARLVFQQSGRGHIAFIGGSITEMNGYRPMVAKRLAERFPHTQFTFTDAGIASTCSTTGAFRLHRDVLSRGPVDLLFVEFAVNDDQDASHSRQDAIRGMEGIIRQLRQHNPNADVVVTYFVNPGMLELLQAGKTPVSIAAHEKVAQYYKLPANNLAQELADRIAAGTFTWKQYGGTHPAQAGNALCASQVDKLMQSAWKDLPAKNAQPTPHELKPPLDEQSYTAARFVAPRTANLARGWELRTPDWQNLPGKCRGRFTERKLLCTIEPGSELTLEFTGRAVGAYLLAGPDAGKVEAQIDDRPSRTIDLYHRFSTGLHYPRTVMFASDLSTGKHKLRLRVVDEHNSASSGNAVRILQFVAN